MDHCFNKEVLKITGKKHIRSLPNLELFIHGAVSFLPYKSLFKDLIPSSHMNYQETYNASEGFFAFQDDLNSIQCYYLPTMVFFMSLKTVSQK